MPHTFTATVEQSADGITWLPGAGRDDVDRDGVRDRLARSCVNMRDERDESRDVHVSRDGCGSGTLTLNVTAIADTTVDGTPVSNLPVPPVDDVEDVGGVSGDGVAVGDERGRCAARVHDHGDAQRRGSGGWRVGRVHVDRGGDRDAGEFVHDRYGGVVHGDGHVVGLRGRGR